MRALSTLMTIVLVLTLAPLAIGQQTAAVTGTVADASGALIPGVGVGATNSNTNITRSAVTGEAGSYTIPALQPGPYTIVASLPGFADSTITVNLTANQTFRYNFVMQVAGTATQIEVISDADALLATTSSSVGDALPENEIEALPLATRDVFDLLNTTAGLVRGEGGDASNFAGQRVSSANTTRDGIVVSDGRYLDWNGAFAATFTSPDLVEEVQISVGTVDPAAGRGSSQVRLQTRSGTNDYHGAVFYSTNNSAFNANNWFDNLRGNEKDWTNRQQFGGRIGGPIIEDKAFFFVLIEEQRYNTRENISGTVLTPQARQGIFRYWPGAENQNALGGADASVDLAGNPVMPQDATGPLASFNLFDDVADPNRGPGISNNAFIQETLARMPAPNDWTVGDGLNTAGHNWVRPRSGSDNAAGTSQDTNRNNMNVRIDYTITDNNKVNVVMSREHNFNDSSLPSWPTGLYGESTRDPRIYTVGYTSTLTPSVVNEFRWGYRQTSWHGRNAPSLGCCFGSDDGPFNNLTPAGEEAAAFVPTNTGTPLTGTPYSISLAVLEDWVGIGIGRSQVSPLWQFGDTASFVMGSHSFQAGWEGIWADSDGWNGGGLYPSANIENGQFQPAIEGVFAGLQNADAGTAEDILNDLSGAVGSVDQRFIVNDPSVGFIDITTSVKQNLNFHQDDWAAFFKDNWNVTNNLTLNYGVRWDVYGVPYEAKGLNVRPTGNRYLGISDGGGLVGFEPVGKNSPNPDLNLYPKDWNNFAPSFGFSYRVPWLDRTTVVRGGYGISYSGAPTFLQYDFGPGAQQGKSRSASQDLLTYTALPGSTNPSAALVDFPLLNINSNGELTDPNDPTFLFVPFGTPAIDGTIRNSSTLFAYTDNRRIPYIQNMNLSVETEIAPDTNLSVTYIGTRGVALWGGQQVNEPNIYASANGETILEAFNITRSGGQSALFDAMLSGISLGSSACGPVDGVTCTGSMALRQNTTTDDWIADGEVADLASWLTETNVGTGDYGGLLRTNGFAENFIKINPQFNQVDLYDNGDSSTYHSLQMQVTKRLSNGFSGQFTYTWSKALGNSSTSSFRAREDQSFWSRDPNNRALQWGVVGFNRTHQFNAHGVWDLPFGPGRTFGSSAPGAMARIIEGWQLAGVFAWSSGSPLGFNDAGGAFGGGGLGTLTGEDAVNTPNIWGDRPKGDVVVDADGNVRFFDGFTREREDTARFYGSDPDGLLDHDDLWQVLDPSGNVLFTNPEPGTTGNLALNSITGPSTLQLDLAMTKSVQIREDMSFSLRVDAINVLNTPQWGDPETNINDVDFGRIDSASGERTFTLNARIDF